MKATRQPDLSAPRYRPVRLSTVTKEYCRLLRKEVPAAAQLNDEEIQSFIESFHQEFCQEVLETREGASLPARLGHVFVGSCPKKSTPNVDFQQSAAYLQTIQHRNFESDGFLAKIFYINEDTRYEFKNHNLWQFDACRDFTRALAKHYPLHWKQYIQVDPGQKVSRLFRDDSYRSYREEKRSRPSLETYNEFEV